VAYDGTQFGLWLREKRKSHDMTQRELAGEIGCSEFTLRKFEAGTRRPSKQIVERLADFFRLAEDEQQRVTAWARFGDGVAGGRNTIEQSGEEAPRVTNNLPTRLTRLIGRERELSEAVAYLRDRGRLLTLTGPPGVGKTRLAVQVASNLLTSEGQSGFDDGVYFVELALVRDAQMLFAAIAQALGYRPPGSQDALADLAGALGGKRMLLVLDNFEQVAQAGPEVVRLLELCPQLKVLVTSREALSVHGEQQLVVPLLPLPDLTISPSSERLLDYASIALFLERATAVKPDFKLTEGNAPEVGAICTRLDGLPLAIELAAAHIKMLPPSAMLARLEGRDLSLALLTGGARNLPTRHQTLRAAIDWSYELLGPPEQTLFARLSVFAGGCDLETLEAVAGPGLEPATVFGLLKSLLDKSLVQQREGASEEPRFYMLETIREHATERLEALGEAEEFRSRHAKYYLDMAEEAEPELGGQDPKTWLDELEQELANIRAALEWALRESEYELAARIAGALRRFWEVRGYWSEGRRWLEAALERGEALPTAIRARVALGAGRLAYFQDEVVQSQSLLEESLRLYRDTDDKRGTAEVLSGLAYLAARQGQRPLATELLEESLGLSRDLGDTRSAARTLTNLGRLAMEGGDFGRAAALQAEALTLFRQLRDKSGMAVSLENLGQLAAEQADYASATALLEESLALNRELGDKGHVAWVLGDLGITTLAAGDYERSLATYEEASRLFLDLGDKSGWATALFMRGVAFAYRGDHETAAGSFRESVQVYREIGDEAGCALGIDGLAFVAASANGPALAARLAGMAERLRGEMGYRVQLIERPMHERTIALVSARLDEGTLEQMLVEGRSMDAEQAIAYALATHPK
jgi:predicted ATPase/DNA-binding XRE family transcriptional regulator